MMNGRVFYTGQAIIDLVMPVAALPPVGGDVYATSFELLPGGGFNTMAAAARDGAEVIYLGTTGSGPFGEKVRAALAREIVAIPNAPIQNRDTGLSVALIEPNAERTFVSALGAEGCVQLHHLNAVTLKPDDIVHVCGYSLRHPTNGRSLVSWLPTVPVETTVVFDPAPLLLEIPMAPWSAIVNRATIWTLNVREAGLALRRLTGVTPDTEDPAVLAVRLAHELSSTVVVRDGAAGAYVVGGSPAHMVDAEPSTRGGGDQPDSATALTPTPVSSRMSLDRAVHEADGRATHVPGHSVVAVDSNGAGDAHAGVLMSALARGETLLAAVRRANAAAALSVTKLGPATAPTRAETDELLGK
ncbi:MAG: PfkB family carbohydrate kinase [Propionibacteriaceae bacterium]|jgi:sugar/nucleoside kinase (ribokinase family)|nr:PfkB family carbohydrate kinase [Propionibacteriaceae bacterium]